MHIALFGASGKVGRLVLAEALRRGHQVTALVHESSLIPAEGLTILHGDIYNRADVAAALEKSDTVISALSSWHRPQKNVLSAAMQSIVPVLEKRDFTRLVSLTGNMANRPGESKVHIWNLARTALKLVAPNVLRDADNHIAILAGSRLDWTVARSPIMTRSNSTAYKLSADRQTLFLSRRAVATALVDLSETTDWTNQAPLISSA